MTPVNTTFLFGDHRIATATSGRGAFAHTFGGPHDRAGASRADCGGILIHLLHRLDLTDPAVPIAVPGVRWLPIYYCFDFRVNVLGYRLLSDDAMVAYFPTDDPNVTAHEEWPGEDYPLEFPRSDIRVAPHAYDPTDLDDAYRWAGVFGIDRLSEPDRAAARHRVAELAEILGFYAPETEEEFDEALSSPFLQGKPTGPCLNPECGAQRLTTVALMPAEPVAGVNTFGRWGDARVIVQLCPTCHALRVSNECD